MGEPQATKIYVFTGPTLRAGEARRALDATYLPPVAQGDVYRASLERPWGIGIVDGFFQQVPAVWHKEILWALRQGVHVFGSASMGALRAAELAPFGMTGVGEIFEAFQSGELEDDDEVAILHGPRESEYRALSEAMVNIRSTVEAAVAKGVLAPETGRGLTAIAKRLFYAKRTYPAIVERGRAEGLPTVELAAFSAWLAEGRVDRKRLDALAMVKRMRQHHASHPEPLRTPFPFHHTDAWEQVRRRIGPQPLAPEVNKNTPDAMLEEARLSGTRHLLELESARVRGLAREVARQRGFSSDAPQLRALLTTLGEEGKIETGAVDEWRLEQDLGEADFLELLRGETDLRHVEALYGSQARGRFLLDQLRLSGRYAPLERRARDKAERLRASGLENPSLAAAGVEEEELWRWYYASLGEARPADLEDRAAELGFLSLAAFRRAVLREYFYQRLVTGDFKSDSGPVES